MISPTLPEIFKELVQLEDDFGNITFDSDENAISVTTERITLEDIPLGEFEIKLFPDRISGESMIWFCDIAGIVL